MPDEFETRHLTRRELLKRAGVGAAGLAVSGTLAEPVWASRRTLEASNTIKPARETPTSSASPSTPGATG